MYHSRLILLVTLATFLVSLAVAALAEPEVSDLISKLIELKKKNIDDDRIIEALGQTLRGPVPLTEGDLARLRAAGVGERVIFELVDRRPRNPRPSANTGNCDKNCWITFMEEKMDCERKRMICEQDCQHLLSPEDVSDYRACSEQCMHQYMTCPVGYLKCIQNCDGCAWALQECTNENSDNYDGLRQCGKTFIDCSQLDERRFDSCKKELHECSNGCLPTDSDENNSIDVECSLACLRKHLECYLACFPD